METKNIVCFGFGQVAKNFIKKLNDQGVPFKLTTTSREDSKNKKFENINYESFQFTEEGFDKNFITRFEKADHILLSISPINGADIVIKNLKDYFKSNKFKWITYLSATSVYGDHKGEWVDENSETKPTSSNGIERLKVEKEWMELVAKEILDDFEVELKKFKQICPVEMLDKLDNPITLKSTIKKVS